MIVFITRVVMTGIAPSLLGYPNSRRINGDLAVDELGTGLFFSGFHVKVESLLVSITLVMALHIAMGIYMMVRVTGGSFVRMATYVPLHTWIVALCWMGSEYILRSF